MGYGDCVGCIVFRIFDGCVIFIGFLGFVVLEFFGFRTVVVFFFIFGFEDIFDRFVWFLFEVVVEDRDGFEDFMLEFVFLLFI